MKADGPERIVPHPPLTFVDGTPYSTLFGDVFRSRHGAFDEAQQVFVEGCLVPQRWAARATFTIVELGFGLGVNLLQTLGAWARAADRPSSLHYVAIERHPVSAEDLTRALAALSADDALSAALVRQWPLPLPGLHRLQFFDDRVRVTLALGDARTLLSKLRCAADAFYLDGFAPDRNPDAWCRDVCRGLARLARPNATLATYSAAAAVRSELEAAGFRLRIESGFGGKRHRIVADYAPRWRTFAPPADPPQWPARKAIVVGAGLAGSACVAALQRRGWQATLVEAGEGMALGGSSQPWCVDHLHVSPDDNPLARLTRGALAFAHATPWTGRHARQACGKLMVAAGDVEMAHYRDLVERLAMPDAFIRVLDRDEASAAAGVPLPHGGLLLGLAGVGSPQALCAQWLRDAGAFPSHFGQRAEALVRRDDDWELLDSRGRAIARAPVVVLANAGNAVRLAGLQSLDVRGMHGQTTLAEVPALAGLSCALGGDAYACPAPDGQALIGATFDPIDAPRAAAQGDQSNLRRLDRLLQTQTCVSQARVIARFAGVRYATRDRLPVVGALPDEAAIAANRQALMRNARLPLPRLPGLFGVFALGARGQVVAPLAAEVIAASLCGEPAPLTGDLLDAIDPVRFARHALRSGRVAV
jgi:tRNA 5-methylaminomethyl-2-thiouridine biosynthesis bifunctional protein